MFTMRSLSVASRTAAAETIPSGVRIGAQADLGGKPGAILTLAEQGHAAVAHFASMRIGNVRVAMRDVCCAHLFGNQTFDGRSFMQPAS